jgi:hypothetical protein
VDRFFRLAQTTKSQIEKMKTFYLFFIVLMVGCQEQVKRTDSNRMTWYTLIPEAPIGIYCQLSNNLNDQAINQICKTIHSIKSDNLSAIITFSLKDSKIEEVYPTYFYFDSLGIRRPQNLNIAGLPGFYEQIDSKSIPVIKDENNGEFVFRIQLEMFCNGRELPR